MWFRTTVPLARLFRARQMLFSSHFDVSDTKLHHHRQQQYQLLYRLGVYQWHQVLVLVLPFLNRTNSKHRQIQWITLTRFTRGGPSSPPCICACSPSAFWCRSSSTFECTATSDETAIFEISRLPTWREPWPNHKLNRWRNPEPPEESTEKNAGQGSINFFRPFAR